jgi:hypothetical protein
MPHRALPSGFEYRIASWLIGWAFPVLVGSRDAEIEADAEQVNQLPSRLSRPASPVQESVLCTGHIISSESVVVRAKERHRTPRRRNASSQASPGP